MAGVLNTAAAPALQLYKDLLNFFFPPTCLVCNAYACDSPVCDNCNDRLVTLPHPVCSQCRTFVQPGPNTCPSHSAMTVWAAGLFDGYYRRLLHHFKFNGRMDAGTFLGQRLAVSLSDSIPAFDALVPVPLHPARQRERGYNQSLHLARVLGAALDVPVAEQVIRRVRNTPSQTDLGREQRQDNVLRAFEADGSQETVGRILLVDDVQTTGSTLEACGDALAEAGIMLVGAAVVALAEPPTASYHLDPGACGNL